MLKYYSFINDFTRIGEKLIYQNINKKMLVDKLGVKQLEITFRIPSESKFEHGFIALLMLTEKMLNNKPIFLLDKNTLSKKRSIKIGLVLTIKNEMVDYYLNLCNFHSVPRFYDYGISFSISSANQPFTYKIKKILSNTIFNFDKDVYSYYDYLGDLDYEFEFLFRTCFKNVLMNKLIVSNKGIYFSNFTELIKSDTLNEIQKQIELEELEELKKLGEENSDIDNFDDIEENVEEELEVFNYSDSDYYFNNDVNFNSEFYVNEEANNIEISNKFDIFNEISNNEESTKYQNLKDESLSLEESKCFAKYEEKICDEIHVNEYFIYKFISSFKNKYINLYVKNKEKILYKDEVFDKEVITNNEF